MCRGCFITVLTITVSPMKQQSREWLIGTTLLALLCVTTLIYWPGLHGDFLLDDFDNLRPLEQLDDSYTSLQDVVFGNDAGPLGRPVAMLTFAANYLLDGNDVWNYKYTNLCIHLLCGVLIFWLAGRLLAHTSFNKQRWQLALFTAGLWLAAPLYVSTTLYVVQRMAQLSALFVFAGLLCYVLGRERMDTRKIPATILIACCFLLFLPLAILSKENGALLPLLALCIEIFFFGFKGEPATRRVIIGLFLLVVALPSVVTIFFIVANPSIYAHGYEGRDFTLWQRILTEPRILFSYTFGLLFPKGSSMGLFHDDYPVSSGLFKPLSTLAAILGWAFVGVFAFLTSKKNLRWLAFGPVFFLAGHTLESSIFPLELYFEHRNYLPGFGIFFSLAIAAGYLYSKFRPSLAVSAMACLLVAYNIAAYQRVRTWASWGSIILSAEIDHPNSSRLQTELASYDASHHELAPALQHLQRALELKPSSWSGVAVHRIAVYCAVGAPIPSVEYSDLLAKKPLNKASYTTNALAVVRTMFDKGDCKQLDIHALTNSVRQWLIEPVYQPTLDNRWRLELELAQFLRMSGNVADAVSFLKQAFELRPEKLESGLLAVKYQLAAGDLNGAAEMINILQKRNKGQRHDYTLSIEVYGSFLRQIRAPKTNPLEHR